METPTFNNIKDWFESVVVAHGNEVAVLMENGITYDELNRRANKLANLLQSEFHIAGKTVGICLPRSPELMISVLAVIKAGAAYVPFDAEYPSERLAYMAKVAAVPVILTNTILFNSIPDGDYSKVNCDELTRVHKFSDANLSITPKQDDPIYILFTSGSTGQPKGVCMPHRAMINLLKWQLNNTSVGPRERTLQFSPISFDVSFQEMFATWCSGGTLVLIKDEWRLSPIKLAAYMQANQVARLFLPFIALQNLTEHLVEGNVKLEKLKEVITAGEQLQSTPAIRAFFKKHNNCRLYNHYGPTETHVVTSFLLENDSDKWESLPSIGKEIDHTEIVLVDENGSLTDEGELLIGGENLALGYVNQPSLTAEKFIDHPHKRGKKLYRTGDIARRLTNGNYQYLGRIDGQVKIRGYRIEIGEVEVALGRHGEISQIAVIPREDKPGEKKLVAYYVSSNRLNSTSLRKYLSLSLPDYMIPSAFICLKELPRTPSGKIDRKKLPAPDLSRPELSDIYIAPATTTEKTLCTLWSDLLQINPIGVKDNFFDLGGNSLLAIQCITRLKHQNRIDVPVTKIYQYPTIARLAKFIDGIETGSNLRTSAEKRFEQLKQNTSDAYDQAIAVIGIALRFPGADTVDQFWKNLCEGVESLTTFSSEQLQYVPEELRNDPAYVKVRGIINDADCFDAEFFGLNPSVAKVADPQQRVFLELAWQALEHAGYNPERCKEIIGVFSGCGNNTYMQNNVWPNPDAIARVGSFLAMTWNEKDYIATRTAFELDLKGPAVSVHTACSTSLTAIVQACESIWQNRCDMALAGGVAITSPICSGQRYEEGAIYSNDGHTRAFDKDAKGTVFSDGAGIVVLKRYKDAVQDGDYIYAIVKGAALNNDGGSKGSFTAPSVDGQAEVIANAQAMAGITADTISYIEAHGTATPLGDPIEIEGLTKAFKESSDAKQFCAVGSVKTNFGHLTAAAGIAGFIKTILSLKYAKLPPSLHFKSSNPSIDFSNSPFYVNASLAEWKKTDFPRRAGVSSFGVGGTNAHVVLEEAPLLDKGSASRPKQLILLSAKTEKALSNRKQLLIDQVTQHAVSNFADTAYTLQIGRKSMQHRWFTVVDNSQEEGVKNLIQTDPKLSGKNVIKQSASGVVFMFPGQGSQYIGMGKTLYADELIYREAVDHCAGIINPLLGIDIREILFADSNDARAEELLKQTCYTQPSLFITGYALSKLWMSWGIKPAALIGHSIGEFVAATISGVFTLEDALLLVASRGKLMYDLPKGSMLSVRLSVADITRKLSPQLSVAAINGPQLCVVAGPDEDINKLQQELEKEDVVCKPLHTSHAFHSPMMDPIIKPFKEIVSKIKLNAPVVPILSTVTTKWLTAEEACNPEYWAAHLRATVCFADGVKSIWAAHPEYIMLECGPRNTASTLARQQVISMQQQKAIPSLGDTYSNHAEWNSILTAIGQLWLSGIEIDYDSFYSYEKRQRIALPGYPFERTKYWLDPPSVNQNPIKEHEIINNMEQAMPQLSTIANNRKEKLVKEIKKILEEASGIDLSAANDESSFSEMGLDSLFLTQIALTLTKKYNNKITFRQLNESLLNPLVLAEYLDNLIPKEETNAVAQLPDRNQVSSSLSTISAFPLAKDQKRVTADNSDLKSLIQQQINLMQQQLQLLNGETAVESVDNRTKTPTENNSLPNKETISRIQFSEEEKEEIKKPFGAIARIEKEKKEQLTAEQQQWLKKFISSYTNKTFKSKEYTQHYRSVLADPRVVTGFKPHLKEITYQPVVNKSKGSKVWDIDGNEYIDVLNGFGSNMFGHSPDFIVKAIEAQLQQGYELGPQHELAGEVAKLICEFTGAERAGLCNTGSEAVLGAMRIARTATGRNLIACFNGSYHGINDEVIVRGTKNLRSLPAAAGVVPTAVENILVVDYGTNESLQILKSRAGELAAILVEPVQSRRADFHPKEFLQQLRSLCDQQGIVLIFDEVITGFRAMQGGAQQYFNIKADLGTYGKVVGGGMPIGVIAGKKEYMDALDGGFWQFGDDSTPPSGVTYFAGTFVRHPFALAAAKASLLYMKEKGPALQEELNTKTSWLAQNINNCCKEMGLPLHIAHFGSLFKVKYEKDLQHSDLIYPLLRYKGIHIYDGFPCFLTEAHSMEDVQEIASKFEETLKELHQFGFLPSLSAPKHSLAFGGVHSNGNGNGKSKEAFAAAPVTGAMLGKDPDGNLGWYVPDENKPGKFKKFNQN